MCSAGHSSCDSITVAQSWVDFRTAINEKKEWHRTKRAQKINSRAETQNKKKRPTSKTQNYRISNSLRDKRGNVIFS